MVTEDPMSGRGMRAEGSLTTPTPHLTTPNSPPFSHFASPGWVFCPNVHLELWFILRPFAPNSGWLSSPARLSHCDSDAYSSDNSDSMPLQGSRVPSGLLIGGFIVLIKRLLWFVTVHFWEQSVRGQNRYSLRYVQNSTPPPPLAKRYKMNGVPTAHSRASEVHERPYAETKLQRLPLGMGFGPASACIHPVTLLPEIFHLLRFQKLFLYFWFISPQKFWRSKPQRNKLSRELSIFPNIYISVDVMSAPVRSPPLALAFPESTDSRIN